MKYWIVSIPRDAMERVLELGILGRNSHQQFQKVSIGDKIVFYVTRESNVVAFGSVTKPYYRSNADIFKDERSNFPHRIDFTSTKVDEPIAFRPKIVQLDFIKKKESWPAYIRRGFAEITEKDWELLQT